MQQLPKSSPHSLGKIYKSTNLSYVRHPISTKNDQLHFLPFISPLGFTITPALSEKNQFESDTCQWSKIQNKSIAHQEHEQFKTCKGKYIIYKQTMNGSKTVRVSLDKEFMR